MKSPRNCFALSGQLAIVTGGARGIGRAIAECLGTRGARICIADIDAAAADASVRELCSLGIPAFGIAVDLSSSAAVDELVRSIVQEDGGFDILVNNAGISARIPAHTYPDDEFDRIINVNVKGVFYAMRAAARSWIAQGRGGRIVNLASFAGLVADPLSAPYAATKGAVVQLTRTCAVEWAEYKIAVNAIAPGYVKTAMVAETLADPALAASVIARTPMRRLAEPDEIAAAALFLASPAASYVTGHVLSVDGGWTAV